MAAPLKRARTATRAPAGAAPPPGGLDAVHAALAAILRRHGGDLAVLRDRPGDLYIDTRHVMPNGKPLFLGAVSQRKDKVSFHLMPVYVEPALLAGLSKALRARMQGKSCFNFARPDPGLFDELERLVAAGRASYRRRGFA